MSKLFQVPPLSMLLFPCSTLISIAMAVSQYASLPDPAADTHAHVVALPRRPHMLDEATYTGGLLVGEVVEWAKGLDPCPTLIQIDKDQARAAVGAKIPRSAFLTFVCSVWNSVAKIGNFVQYHELPL